MTKLHNDELPSKLPI